MIKVHAKCLLCFYLLFCFSCSKSKVLELDGELFYRISGSLKNGDIYGSFYESGLKKTQYTIVDGVPNGDYCQFDSLGNLSTSGKFVNGRLGGVLLGFDIDGSLLLEENYKNGKRYGWMKIYNRNEAVESEAYFLKDSVFYSKSYILNFEQITPVLTLSKDSIFVGDTITMQYRVPVFDEVSVDKDLYLFFRIESANKKGTLYYPNDSLHITSEKAKQIGLVIENSGEQMIYGFLGSRTDEENINYKEYRKYITVYPRSLKSVNKN